MLSNRDGLPKYRRSVAAVLAQRVAEPRRFIQVLSGPRQVGKTTLVRQVLSDQSFPHFYASADEPSLRDATWLHEQWGSARFALEDQSNDKALLVIDEVQKIAGWSEAVKRLWDEDTAAERNLLVVLLGSAPLLVQQGLTESLAGRFEIIPVSHWSYLEMHDAFGWDVDTYVVYGGYPGASPLIDDPERWRRYILDALVETTISRDVLLLTRVDKPALLRRLFELACNYSGQILSYTKMLGQLVDAGNTTTLAHYLELLHGAGMVLGLPKYSGKEVRRRAASPKLQVMNTALMSAMAGHSLEHAKADQAAWGRLVESSVGSHLVNAQARGECKVFYWREGDREVDFVVQSPSEALTAIEVKSGSVRGAYRRGMDAFAGRYGPARAILVGDDGISVADFLSKQLDSWI